MRIIPSNSSWLQIFQLGKWLFSLLLRLLHLPWTATGAVNNFVAIQHVGAHDFEASESKNRSWIEHCVCVGVDRNFRMTTYVVGFWSQGTCITTWLAVSTYHAWDTSTNQDEAAKAPPENPYRNAWIIHLLMQGGSKIKSFFFFLWSNLYHYLNLQLVWTCDWLTKMSANFPHQV